MDFIADFLTRIRNAYSAGHESLTVPTSNLTNQIAQLLKEEGFIGDYKLIEGEGKKSLRIQLRYVQPKQPAVQKITRLSKPGIRKYVGAGEIPKVLSGLGVAILSTSKGILTDKQARRQNIGGELLCSIY